MCSDQIYIFSTKFCCVIFNKSFTSLSVNRRHQTMYRFMVMYKCIKQVLNEVH